MSELIKQLQKAHDTLEWKLTGLAMGSFAGGVIMSDIPRALSEDNYALAITELVLTTVFGYGAYREGKKIKQDY